MDAVRTQDIVPIELMKKLDIALHEDAAKAIVRALALIESLDPRKYIAFTAYYGLRGFKATLPREIGEGLGIKKQSVVSLIEAVERFVSEEVRALRWTRIFPNEHVRWPSEDFFTVARALADEVSFTSATRIRNFILKERVDYPTVQDVVMLTENGLLQIPGAGAAMVNDIQKMLWPVGLKLATH